MIGSSQLTYMPLPIENEGSDRKVMKKSPDKESVSRFDVYVSRRSGHDALLRRCMDMLHEDGTKFITVHALGAAIPAAIDISLKVRDLYKGDLRVNPTTSTVNLYDEVVEDEEKDKKTAVEARRNSAIHIRLEKGT